MNEISCPHCNKAFKVDETGYAHILKQVRDSEFDKQLQERLELAGKEKQNAIELTKEKTINQMRDDASKKIKEASENLAERDRLIAQLKAQVDANEMKEKLAINEAVNDIEKERDELRNNLKETQLKSELAENSLKDKYETQDRDDAIERLKDMKARLSTKMIGETPKSTAKPNLTESDQQLFQTHILKKITMQEAEVRVTTFLKIRILREPRSSRSCLK